MHCPESIIFRSKPLTITHYATTDFISWDRVPLRQKLNPLRYELRFWRWSRGMALIVVNEEGRAALALAETIYRLKRPRPSATATSEAEK